MELISRICRLVTVLPIRKPLSGVLAVGLFSFSFSAWAQTPLNPCDLAAPYGTIDQADVTAAVNMVLNPATCTANIDGANVCNVVIVQRVVNASLTGTCVIGNPHTVTLNWVASASSGVAGYNVYRGTVSGGPYTKVNSSLIAAITYTDSTVQAGQTYYYVATAVSTGGTESAYSSPPVPAVVPYP